MQQTGTGIKQVGRVVIPVSDQARARAFYTETLGFEVRGEFVMSPEYIAGSRWHRPARSTDAGDRAAARRARPVGVDTGIASRDARHRGRPRGR